MKVKRVECKASDFTRVSTFLKDTYSEESSNWTIERWSWSRYFNGYWLEVFESWLRSIGMWVDENNHILALLLNEGDLDGDIFFQLRDQPYEEAFVHEMLDYAEELLAYQHEGKKQLFPRVNNMHKELLSKVLSERGYSDSGRYEHDAALTMASDLLVELPKGYSIKEANEYDASARALAHGRAFSVEEDSVQLLMESRKRAYTGLGQSPDYDTHLDLCIVDEDDVIAAFATFWFDEQNMIASLEPLGTVPTYQKLGLAKALVFEGVNRLRQRGATKLHVGSNQAFYHRIGFKELLVTEIWQKEFE